MIYPKPTKILLDDARVQRPKRGGRPKGTIRLERDSEVKIRITTYERDILTLASHVLGEDYHDILVKPAMRYSIRKLIEEGVDIPTSAPPAPNPTACKPK